MKKILFLLVAIATMVVGCSTPEKKAQNLIRQQLKESLHDWKSYESVKFGTLDSAYTSVSETPEWLNLRKKGEELKVKIEEINIECEYYQKLGPLFRDEAIRKAKELKKYAEEIGDVGRAMGNMIDAFVPEFKGWQMEHSYRANNLAGNKGIHHYIYYFDKNLTEILSSEDNNAD